MAITLVVFDVIGTTVLDGGAVSRCMRDALGAAGLVLRDGATDGVAGMAKVQAIRTLIEGHGREELIGRVDAIHADFVARMRAVYRESPAVVAAPGVLDTFRTLRERGVRVALDTGFSRPLLDVILTRMGWLDGGPVDATVSSDEVARGRPYPDMIDALRARFGGVPTECVAKVGDTPTDLQEGTMGRCGMVIGVYRTSAARDLLAAHPHDVLVESVADVPELLRAHDSRD